MPASNWHLRFALAALALAATAAFLEARSRPERLPDRQELQRFPMEIGDWRGREVPITAEIRQVLGDGDFMDRAFTRPDAPFVDLFIAYFPTQRTGSSIHSPKNCLPGSGWTPVDSGHYVLQTPDGRSVQVNRYIVARGQERQLVFYWYQSHDRLVASEYWAKIYLVADSIRMNRSDGALVRLVTPVLPGEDPRQADQRVADFARLVMPRLNPHIPR